MGSRSFLSVIIATTLCATGCGDDAVGADAVSADSGVSAADTSVTEPTDVGPGPMIDAPFDGGAVANPECDLNGRWLVSQRVVAAAIGQKQASHNWFYFEIRQDGENVTVTKGLHCGFEVVKVTTFGANVKCEAAWPSMLQKCSSTGRKGHYKLAGDRCAFDLAKEYVVRGATVAAYLDPSKALPNASQPASGTTPGWEDWEADGKPGVTMNVTGAATGKLFVVQRDWNEYAGTTPKSASKFSIPVKWDAEQSILGREGPSLIEQDSAPDSDASQHFAMFHKLTPEQTAGSDADICAAVRRLKDTLVPEANK